MPVATHGHARDKNIKKFGPMKPPRRTPEPTHSRTRRGCAAPFPATRPPPLRYPLLAPSEASYPRRASGRAPASLRPLPPPRSGCSTTRPEFDIGIPPLLAAFCKVDSERRFLAFGFRGASAGDVGRRPRRRAEEAPGGGLQRRRRRLGRLFCSQLPSVSAVCGFGCDGICRP
jgi:hypothetical protein